MTYADTPRSRGDTNAPHVSPVTPEEDARTILINRVSWGAVLAGVVVALVTHLILSMLGVGIGAATIDPLSTDNPTAERFSLIASIWWTVSGIIAALAGGYTAGRLSGQPTEGSGGWHGLTAWALTTLVIFFLLGSAVGTVIGGTLNALTTAAGGVAQTAGTAVQRAAPALTTATDPFAQIEQSLRSATGGGDPAAMREAAVAAVRAALTGSDAKAEEARQKAAEAIASAQNIPVEDARAQVQQYEQDYKQTVQEVRQQAAEAADMAARAVSRGALFGAIALLLGALAGWFGGRMGVVEPTITRQRLFRRTSGA